MIKMQLKANAEGRERERGGREREVLPSGSLPFEGATPTPMLPETANDSPSEAPALLMSPT